MSVRQAVILAAGEGSRMRPLTYTRPKAMLSFANKPVLEHLLSEMRTAGIAEFIFVVGYRAEQIKDYFGEGEKWGVKIRYSFQKERAGTADALREVQGQLSGNFLVANSDIIIEHQDIQNLAGSSGNFMSVIELPDVTGLGVIEVKDQNVTRIHEKSANPPTRLANAGLYLFTPEIFQGIHNTGKSPRGEYEITDSIRWLIDNAQSVSFRKISFWLDFSYPWDLLTANEKFMANLKPQNLGEVEPNVVLRGPVSIGKGTLIKSGAYIVGPVIIGDNCEIGPNCYIRPNTAIGNNCHIGASVEVKNSIILSGSKVPHLNYVGDSIIGENCNLGAGTKIANLRLDKKNIVISGTDTHRRKLGVIMGDGVETGINASINVGTLIGNNTFIGPGALAHGVIAPNSKIF